MFLNQSYSDYLLLEKESNVYREKGVHFGKTYLHLDQWSDLFFAYGPNCFSNLSANIEFVRLTPFCQWSDVGKCTT